MAHFQKAPVGVLTHTPASLTQAVRDVLARPGTYNIFNENQYRLKISIGNTTWKGLQAKIIGQWGGDDQGNRLEVIADPPTVDVTLISETPVSEHLWVWLVQTRTGEGAAAGTTELKARTRFNAPGKPAGTLHAAPLPVDILPERGTPRGVAPFAGGNRQTTVNAIIAECRRQGVALNSQIAYILATAEHECGFTPVRERFTDAHEPERRRLRYYPYYGRGYVQLTLEGNYRTYETLLEVPLVADPDLAMQTDVALFVLVHGMMHGTFGLALTRFVNARGTDFLHARQSVNGMDRAERIAGLAEAWLRRLNAGRP